MVRIRKILLVVVSALVGIFFILPLIGVGILKWAVLPPEKLTPLVVEKTNEFIEAHLECERVELTYFETYPYLGVKLTNGRLISHQAEDSIEHQEDLMIPSDSLLSFKKAIVVFNPTDYLFSGKVTIPRVIMDSIRFYGYVNEEGKANWEIYQSEMDSVDESSSSPLPKIDLQQVHITNGHFVYDDRQQDLYTAIDGFFLHIDGLLTQRGNKLDVETGSSSIVFRSPSYSLANKLALRFKGRLLLADGLRRIGLRDAELLVNNLPFTADGFMVPATEDNPSRIDMTFGLKVSDMNDLLHFIPDEYFKDRDKTLAEGRIILDGDIRGELGDSIVPTVNLCCKIEDGSYHVKGIEQGIDTLRMDVDLHLNGAYPDSSYVSLEELTLIGLNTSLTMSGEVRDIWRNPAIRAEMKGQVDFTRLAKEFLNPDTLLLEGTMMADLSTVFKVDDIVNSRFAKVKSSGNLTVDRFKAFSKPLGVDMYIAGANLFVGSTENESKYLNAKGLLSANLSVDTLNIKYKDEISTNIGGLKMVANTTPVIDTTAVIPMTAGLEFDHLRTKLPDSTWMVAGKTVLKGGIKASSTDKRIPMAGATISVDTLKYILIPLRTGMVLTESQFSLEALPYRQAIRQQRERRIAAGDTLRRRTQTTRRANRQRSQVDSVASSNSVLRQWEARGQVRFKQLRGFSRLFPIPMYIDETSVKFNTNNMTLSGARLHLGKSDLTLSGELSDIRRAMLRGGKLKANFELGSDLIDCNQLMLAIGKGLQFSDQLASNSVGAFSEDSISVLETDHLLANTVDNVATDSISQLFVVPKFLDLTLHTNAKKIDFKDLKLEDVKGEVVIRDQSINLSDLCMSSNIGSGDLTMVYTTKTDQEATMGFELSLNDILVERLISLFPDIDTLVPMLRSFEGMVDCQMTATCKADSTMSVLLPSVNASCYLSGKNMVLLDGETFTEISKTLMFKNKKRNMIDSIAVDLAIHDNKIEVFPFLVEMDRYKVAVGGTHNLDMTFDYHLSVLKSPVPFKLGIDIKGNLDDFKFKIVKCKYKDFLKPAKQAELDSTRRNVREEIRETIRKQIREAAPELGNSLSEIHPHTHGHVEEST